MLGTYTVTHVHVVIMDPVMTTGEVKMVSAESEICPLLSNLHVSCLLLQIRTLWGSFDIKNVRLAKTMLKQFSG